MRSSARSREVREHEQGIQGPRDSRWELHRARAGCPHGGFNTLASFQMAMMFGDKKVKCGDQNNPDLYKKP